jgi:hypothetical protein
MFSIIKTDILSIKMSESIQQKQTKFPYVLYKILQDPANSDHIRWNDDGKSFVVINTRDINTLVLCKYFKNSTFNLFVQQLNIYNFYIEKTDVFQDDCNFTCSNEFFLREHPNLLEFVKFYNEFRYNQSIQTQNLIELQLRVNYLIMIDKSLDHEYMQTIETYNKNRHLLDGFRIIYENLNLVIASLNIE